MRFTAASLAVFLCFASAASAQSPNVPNPQSIGRANVPTRPSPQASGGRLNGRNIIPARRQNNGQRGRPAVSPSSTRNAQSDRTSTVANERIASRSDSPPIRQLTGPERALQQRLAAIDRMRDSAVETGNVILLERADELERMAREQHARMIGEQVSPERLPAYNQDNDPQSNRSLESRSVGRPEVDRRGFGQAIAEQARTMGREFGQFTSEQARRLGRAFGQSNADKTRLLSPPAPAEPAPVEPAPVEPIPVLEPVQQP